MDPITIVLLIVAIVIGLVLGFIVNRLIASSSSKNAAREAASLVEDAKKQAETLRREAAVEAKDEALRYKQEMEKENKERMREVRSAENRIAQREESLDRRVESLDAREHQLSSLQGQVERRERDVEEAENAIERHREEAQIEINQALERAAGMSPQEAKEELLETIHDEVTRESAVIIRDAETRTKAEADKKAREILSLAIQRVAADQGAVALRIQRDAALLRQRRKIRKDFLDHRSKLDSLIPCHLLQIAHFQQCLGHLRQPLSLLAQEGEKLRSLR